VILIFQLCNSVSYYSRNIQLCITFFFAVQILFHCAWNSLLFPYQKYCSLSLVLLCRKMQPIVYYTSRIECAISVYIAKRVKQVGRGDIAHIRFLSSMIFFTTNLRKSIEDYCIVSLSNVYGFLTDLFEVQL